MTRVAEFHSANEEQKPPGWRVYHYNRMCPAGRDIRLYQRRPGQNSYRPCNDCVKFTQEGK